MCIICVGLQGGKITSREAGRALGEIQNDLPKEHLEAVIDAIYLKHELEEKQNEPHEFSGFGD